MTTCYIAGPMRGIPEFNFPRFMAADALLSGFGWHVYNPARHDLDTGSVSILDPGYPTGDVNGLPRFDLDEAFQWDEAAIRVSDALVLLDGWALSAGAHREYRLARSLDKDIFRLEHHEDRLQPWVLNGPLGDVEFQWMDEYEPVYTLPTTKEQWLLGYDGTEVIASGGYTLNPDVVRATQEFMVTDPVTGGQKGSKLARFDLLPYDVLTLVAEHFGKGAAKYEDRNWERGYDWGLSMAALQRHLAAFWDGEDVDEETGSFHLQAVIFHAMALLAFQIRDIGTDSRGTVGQ